MADRTSKQAAGAASPPGGVDRSGHNASSPPLKDGEGKRKEDHEPEFTHDIEINDQRNRYMLTKGQTQTQLFQETGASVSTKGTWYPDKSMATPQDPPLYLHIAATSQEILNKAIAAVEELIKQELPDLNPDPRRHRQEREERPPPERRRWPEDKVYIDLEPLRNFNVRAKVVGPGGLFVKYIQGETGTRVQIKGQGSGFIESELGREGDEKMHVSIAGPDEAQVKAAKELAEDLLDAVKNEYAKAYAVLQQQGVWVPPFAGAAGQQQQQPYGAYQQQGQAGWYGAQGQMSGGHAQGGMPPQPDDPAPPPPPEDAAPPPPGDDYAPPPPAEQKRFVPATAAPAPIKQKTAEEQALEKYWADYKKWQESYVAYHGRVPTKDEGGQDIPSEFR
ncbi:eukaryotic type kh-domain (kh-domain type i) [Ceraceosorus bombacis]|uniref:Eukaryotic type kh-domain (Kh-domain type i) n=1 Tax=Ceraceosorus bombacis TaxID=401625 RepID=A0A0P1B8F5_9BASI|nr:eukaryotic type kh-domain (kh-domain type i) [Ceraceosorus bombacis]